MNDMNDKKNDKYTYYKPNLFHRWQVDVFINTINCILLGYLLSFKINVRKHTHVYFARGEEKN